MQTIQYTLTSKLAFIPTKAHPDDIGYDLTAVSVAKKFNDQVTLYDTGLAMTPPQGYYLEIAPRSSLSKSGYMLANSVGIIDPQYTGNLMIALRKVDESMPDLVPPFCVCQLIVRKAEYFDLEEVNELKVTSEDFVRGRGEAPPRGDGGFGSSENHLVVTQPNRPVPFQSLINVLEEFKRRGQPKPLRSMVAIRMAEIDPDYLGNLGYKTFRHFSKTAMEAGVVVLDGSSGDERIWLRE